MFGESNGNHPFDEIPTYAAPAGCRENNDVSNGATAASFPAVEVGEGDNFTTKLYYR